jgi:hypothetical protein
MPATSLDTNKEALIPPFGAYEQEFDESFYVLVIIVLGLGLAGLPAV